MLLRVFSDIHWEFDFKKRMQDKTHKFWAPTELPTDSETTLILAGDLWYGDKSAEIIKTFNKRFEHVICLLGNHDYWTVGGNKFFYEATARALRGALYECDNVYVLDDNTLEIDGQLFVGGTLWTDMDNHNPKIMREAPQVMYPDFEYIVTDLKMSEYYIINEIKMTSEFWLRKHKNTWKYINHVINNNKEKQIVVITHHLPSLLSCHAKYAGDSANHYFASEYKDTIETYDNVPLWIHGHSHSPADYTIGKTRVLANPRGYPNEDSGFKESIITEI